MEIKATSVSTKLKLKLKLSLAITYAPAIRMSLVRIVMQNLFIEANKPLQYSVQYKLYPYCYCHSLILILLSPSTICQ